jgi:hypothetical protein
LPPGEGGKLYGLLKRGRDLIPAEMQATKVASLEKSELLKEALATTKEPTAIMRDGFSLLGNASEIKAKPEEVRSWAARVSKAAEVYGPAWQRERLLDLVNILGEQKGYEAIALTYARQVERMLEDKDRPDVRRRVLSVLADALERAGKAEEAKEVQARARKVDLTIKPQPFTGRQGKSNRVVLLEFFTGAECPPCVAPDLAFAALGKTFKPTEMIRLQYHLHAPAPDPLTNPSGEARSEYYRIDGTPRMMLDGQPILESDGGDAMASWEKYDDYRETIVAMLERPAKAAIKAAVSRNGSKISLDVTVSDVQAEGNNIRLRVALVEEQVDYLGGNKIAEHPKVVRAFLGGVKGEKITKGESFKKTLTTDVETVRKELREYLDKMSKEAKFPRKERPLELKNLRLVAFVQNDATREHEVLQAIEVEVPAN